VLPGANGGKLARGRIWVSNRSTATLLSAPTAHDGDPGALTRRSATCSAWMTSW